MSISNHGFVGKKVTVISEESCDMKRYLLFAGDYYYPVGGMEDFIGDFSTIERAKNKGVELIKNNKADWAHVYDALNMEMVDELNENEL